MNSGFFKSKINLIWGPQKGFTLLEMLLSIAVIGIMVGISAPVYRSLQTRSDTDVAVSTIVQSLRRAQVLSQAVDSDATWGLKVQASSIVLFRGVSYAARTSAFDEAFELPATITPSGVTEIVYAKMTGLPQATGSLILTSTVGDNKTIAINSKGMVDY